MLKKRPANPATEPVLVTAVGCDLFGPDHVLMTLHYLVDLDDIIGPRTSARFVLQASHMKAIGLKLVEAADLSAHMKNPPGHA